MNNVPAVKLGLVAVSRDCFPIELSRNAAGQGRRGRSQEARPRDQGDAQRSSRTKRTP